MNSRLLAGVLLLTSSLAAGQDNQLRNLPPTDKPRFTVADRTWPAQPGAASICLWQDDKLAAASFTIDDNWVSDHPWWLAAGDKYGYKFTWFVISGRIAEKRHPVFGTWDDFQKLQAAGHDVQSHTTTHFNPDVKRNQETEAIYKEAIEDIEKAVPGTQVTTLAYPGGKNAKNDPALAAKYYTAARGTRGHVNNAATTNYLDTYSIGNGMVISDPKHWATLEHLTDPKHKNFRAWGCMHFHGLENPKDPEKSARLQVEKILEYLKQHEADFWVGTFTEVTHYGQQRDTATLHSEMSGKSVKIALTDKMDDKLFTTPLTVKIRLDSSWGKVTAKQGSKDLLVKVIEHDGARFALVPVAPDQGEAVLTAE